MRRHNRTAIIRQPGLVEQRRFACPTAMLNAGLNQDESEIFGWQAHLGTCRTDPRESERHDQCQRLLGPLILLASTNGRLIWPGWIPWLIARRAARSICTDPTCDRTLAHRRTRIIADRASR